MMFQKGILLRVILLILSFDSFSQKESRPPEVWINHSITSEIHKVNIVESEKFKNRNRFGASLGLETRRFLRNNFSIDLGLQFKTLRQSYLFGNRELFITDINFHTPVLMNYAMMLTKEHFLNLKAGLNGVIQVEQNTLASSGDYSMQIIRNGGYHPNVKFGFGYKFTRKHSFEINILSNLGITQKNTVFLEYKPSESVVTSKTNGSFVELEIQYKLK